MLKFHGRLKFKQYNRSKRARFGLKLYRLCESTEDTVCVDTLGILRCIVAKIGMKTYLLAQKWYWIYAKIYAKILDNWYSSPQLFHTLLLNKTHAVGTVRLTRKQMLNNFPEIKIKKGYHVFKTANGVMALLWKDRKDVKMLSTWHTSEIIPTGKTNASGISITKPAYVISYNNGMGGVDRSDQISATCRSVRKHVKW